ncbi:unnamed protein product [Caenorhabditis auriculariae]|uniref:Ankyrin repeat domain-containing protein n=1 Tax=Caenorhabditis auriculariae TaxID=2777116 RepID=A0A8S1H035_9PELO|nr:unnamed protein product [Caenorhabditis auriculariae]
MADMKDIQEEGEGMNLGFTKELIDEIRDRKEANPGMFVSAWQEDEEGVDEKDLDDPVEKFLTAAEEGKLEELAEMFAAEPSFVQAADRDGYTALHRAAYNNNLQIIDFLVSHGSNTEARTNSGWTPLLSAANWANFEAVGRLISKGADVNALSEGHLSALHLAVNSSCEDPENIFHTVRYLLEAPGINATVVSGAGDTPLDLARRNNGQIYHLIREFLDRP